MRGRERDTGRLKDLSTRESVTPQIMEGVSMIQLCKECL